jgi:hypothetical protein
VSAALDRAGEGEKPRAVVVVAEQRLLLLLRIPAGVLVRFEGDVKACRAAQRDVLRGQDLYGLLLGIHSFQIRKKLLGFIRPEFDMRSGSFFSAVLGIRIRIHRIRMFLGLQDLDPDPLVRGTVRIRIRILPFSHRGVERTEIMLAK